MQDCVTVIFGGSDGLGKALAKRLASSGDKVIVVGRNAERTQLTASQIGGVAVIADVTDPNSIQKAVVEIMQRFGRMDRVIYSAGIWKDGQTGSYDWNTITELVTVNQIAPIYLTQLVLPILSSQGEGQLVYVVSKDALYAKQNRSVYHASKWGLHGYIQCLRHDLQGLPVSVLAVYPGLMRTGLFVKSGAERDLSESMEPFWVAEKMCQVMETSTQGMVTELHLDPIPQLVRQD